MIKLKENGLLVIVALVGVLSIFLLKTPTNGETQLMNKIYLMLMICYFVLDQFGLVMRMLRKTIKLKEVFKHYLFFFSVTVFVLMVVNRCVDGILSSLGTEFSNSTCFFATLFFVFITWLTLNLLNKVK